MYLLTSYYDLCIIEYLGKKYFDDFINESKTRDFNMMTFGECLIYFFVDFKNTNYIGSVSIEDCRLYKHRSDDKYKIHVSTNSNEVVKIDNESMIKVKDFEISITEEELLYSHEIFSGRPERDMLIYMLQSQYGGRGFKDFMLRFRYLT